MAHTLRAAVAAFAIAVTVGACEHDRPPRTGVTGTTLAHQLCDRQQGGSFNTNLTLNPANAFRAQVPIDGIRPGDVFRVTATGRMHNGTVLGHERDAEGEDSIVGANEPGWPMPGGRRFGVVVTWNPTGSHFFVGADSRCQVVPEGGATGPNVPRVFFATVNDDWVADNTGSFDLVFRVYRP